VILNDVRLIDGTGQVHERVAIHIEGERIAAVTEPVGSDERRSREDVLDLGGKTVIPGLINCHTHLCLDGSPDPEESLRTRSLTENVLVAANHARSALEAGVTAVRDLGGAQGIDFGLKKAVREGLVPGPRMLVSGRVLCMTGGHGHFMGLEVDGPDEVRKGARQQLKAGADVVKVMATGGVMTPGVEPGSAQLTYEEIRAAVEEAEKAGKLTATHAQGTTGIKNAVRAGIQSVEHGFYLDEEAIDMMLERGTVFVPTLAALYHIVEAGTEAGIPPFVVEKAKRAEQAQLESVRQAWEAGVPIGAGNDGGTPFNLAGNLASELECLVAAGLSPAEALASAHQTAATLLGVADRLGTIEPVKLADLVVLDGDPLADISAVRQVYLVVQGGQQI
jgi:imidazolonepropionase-like amidohydrolase